MEQKEVTEMGASSRSPVSWEHNLKTQLDGLGFCYHPPPSHESFLSGAFAKKCRFKGSSPKLPLQVLWYRPPNLVLTSSTPGFQAHPLPPSRDGILQVSSLGCVCAHVCLRDGGQGLL